MTFRVPPLAAIVRTARSVGAGLLLASLVLVGCASPTRAPATAALRPSGLQGLPRLSGPPPVPFGGTLPMTFSGTLPMTVSATRPAQVTSVFLRFPQNSVNGQPWRVLVALHGIGGDGQTFAADLTAAADRYGWVLVAPTIAYGDWMDPVQVAGEDAVLINWLSAYLAQLPTQTAQPIDSGVLLLGFSRGAQLAHRFAEAYPQQVLAVAAASAGCYTLPQQTAADGTVLPFPYGVGDLATTVGQVFAPTQLRSVHFWVGVGNNDTNPADVPRQFDSYQGDDRLDRARAFVAALGALDVSAELAVFPNVPHALTPDMEGAAIAFLAGQSAPAA